MDTELFQSIVLDEEDNNIMVVTNSSLVDFTFSLFDRFVSEVLDNQETIEDDDSGEELVASVISYAEAIIDDALVEELTPTVTQVIQVGSTLIIVVELDQEIIEYLDEGYADTDSVAAVIFGDSDSEEDESDEDDDESDEDDDEDEDEDEWDVD
tara:strand:+ start:55409 stop:55870 length:462 start_codon:yes stop_codon:yes gene_type:complete